MALPPELEAWRNEAPPMTLSSARQSLSLYCTLPDGTMSSTCRIADQRAELWRLWVVFRKSGGSRCLPQSDGMICCTIQN